MLFVNKMSHTLHSPSSEYAQSPNWPPQPRGCGPRGAACIRGRRTMAELKIDPFLLPSTSLFKLRRQLARAARHTSKYTETHLNRHGLPRAWHTQKKKIHCDASANPINVCPGYIQQHFHIYNRMIICLNMKLDIVCTS